VRLSSKVRYALECLFELSRFPSEEKTSEEIAAARSIPPAYARKILQELSRHGIVISRKGAGYRLDRSLAEITALSVIRAVEERGDAQPEGAVAILQRHVDLALAQTTLDSFPQD
jgi:Rrf2 family protein